MLPADTPKPARLQPGLLLKRQAGMSEYQSAADWFTERPVARMSFFTHADDKGDRAQSATVDEQIVERSGGALNPHASLHALEGEQEPHALQRHEKRRSFGCQCVALSQSVPPALAQRSPSVGDENVRRSVYRLLSKLHVVFKASILAAKSVLPRAVETHVSGPPRMSSRDAQQALVRRAHAHLPR
jgi:hypothetical protein